MSVQSTLSSPWGSDVWVPIAFTLEEALSRPPRARLRVLATKTDIAATDILGKEVTLTLLTEVGGQPVRRFSGIVALISPGALVRGSQERYYDLELVPKLWLLRGEVKYMVYEEKSATDVIQTVLQGVGQSCQIKGQSTPSPTRDYCVQYAETSFDFVSRLLEEEGLFYYFEYSDGSHKMILCGSSATCAKITDEIGFVEPGSGFEGITEWQDGQSIGSDTWTLQGYDYNTAAVSGSASITRTAPSKLERQEWLSRYQTPSNDLAKTWAQVQGDAEQAGRRVVSGVGDCSAFVAGQSFTFTSPMTPSDNQFLLTSVIQEFRYRATDKSIVKERPELITRFTAIPAATSYRPPAVTPRPLIAGPHTALVTDGAENANIDKLGRIKVKFYWFEQPSCWLRVAQPLAHNGWGMVFLPRKDMEVVVAFLDGNPDRPLVVGAVYNADNAPPWALPSKRTQSGYRSRSFDSSESDANEWRFDDQNGSEQVFMQAKKDFQRIVFNDDTLEVRHDRTVTVTNDVKTTVKEGNETHEITKGNLTLTVAEGNETHEVSKGNLALTVATGNETHEVSKGDQTVTIGTGKQTIKVAGDRTITVSTGNQSTNVQAGKVSITAAQSIELTCGSNKITIDQSGITLKGVQIKATADAQYKISAPIGEVGADGMLTVKGGIVKIN